MSPIIKRELHENIGSTALFRALCEYRFIRRIANKRIKVKGVINWFENQVNDRALNLSFKKHFPNITVKGYQGFMPIKYYASLQPQEYEKQLGTIPDHIYVLNKVTSDLYKKSCPSLSIKIAPAFRFAHLFKMDAKNITSSKMILVALPGSGMENESIGILKSIIQALDFQDNNINFEIKIHPTCSKKDILDSVPELIHKNIKFSEESIPQLLVRSDLVISSASSVCVEAASLGIPVAVYGNRFGVTMNPLEKTSMDNISTIFYDDSDLQSFIKIATEESGKTSEVNHWFSEVNRDNTRELFLGF